MNGEKRSRICTICVRGGSKGLPNKNKLILGGVPLLTHTIRQAKRCGLFEVVVVSSEDDALLEIADKEGVELVKRPIELANDTSPKLPAIRHAVLEIESRTSIVFDTIADLDATSPLRLPEDITAAINLLESKELASVFSATAARHSPYFNQVQLHSGNLWGPVVQMEAPLSTRQSSPSTYDMNASIYVWSRNTFISQPRIFYAKTNLYPMPPERSVDIDSQFDFDIVRFLMEERKKNDRY